MDGLVLDHTSIWSGEIQTVYRLQELLMHFVRNEVKGTSFTNLIVSTVAFSEFSMYDLIRMPASIPIFSLPICFVCLLLWVLDFSYYFLNSCYDIELLLCCWSHSNKLSSQCWVFVFDLCLPPTPSNNCYRIQRTLCRTLQNLIDLCILIALTSTLKMFWLMQCLHINGYQLDIWYAQYMRNGFHE